MRRPAAAAALPPKQLRWQGGWAEETQSEAPRRSLCSATAMLLPVMQPAMQPPLPPGVSKRERERGFDLAAAEAATATAMAAVATWRRWRMRRPRQERRQ